MYNRKNFVKFLINIVIVWVFSVPVFAFLFGSMEQLFFKTEPNLNALLILSLVVTSIMYLTIIALRFSIPILELKDLQKRLDAGLITQEDYEAKKVDIISKM